jgi:hypothetical protein
VKTVGNRPTNSPEEEKGTNPGTSQPAKQGFINLILSPHTAKNHPKGRGLTILSIGESPIDPSLGRLGMTVSEKARIAY